MSDLRTPDRRTCTRCGRRERYDDAAGAWRVQVVDGDRRVGDPFCVHEWDIDGSFDPTTDPEPDDPESAGDPDSGDPDDATGRNAGT